MISVKTLLDKESKRLFKNSAWVFFANFYSTALAFLRSILIARGLGASVFGTYAVVVAFVGVVQEFLNLNLGTALIRFGAVFHNGGRNDKLFALVRASLRLSAIMAVVSVAIVSILCFASYDTFIKEPGLEMFVIAYAVAAGITYFNSVSKGMLRLYFRFRMSSMIEMIMDTIETIVVALVIFIYPKNINAFFIAIIIARFLNGFICNLMAFRELQSEWEPYRNEGLEAIREDRQELRGFILGNSLGNTMKTVINQGDVLLLGALAPPEQVGYYAVSKKLAYSVLTLTDPLVSSIYPQLSRLLAEGRFSDVRKMLRRITWLASVPAAAALGLMYFLNKWLIVTIYGSEYMPASGSFFYFFAAALLGAVTFWTLPLVQSLGLVKMRIKAYAVTILAGFLLAAFLIPSLQAEGMSIALLLTNILNATIFIYFSFRVMKLKDDGSSVVV